MDRLMREYHKIQTVFLRDPATNYKTLLVGEYARPEFGYLAQNEWAFTEKVDGTNIRVMWDGQAVRYGGKTERASIPASLLARLQDLFDDIIPVAYPELDNLCLYGEGYGAKIQAGGENYKADGADFVLFDVQIGGLWLERENIADVAARLGIRVVPIIGRGTLWGAVSIAQQGFTSTWGEFPAEGLVMRPMVELQDRRGERIIAKIKTKDFDGLPKAGRDG